MSNYVFDGKYGPIPNKNGEIDLSYYASEYFTDYHNITELPEENKAYLDEVLTTGKYKVTNMCAMFSGCDRLISLDVSKWDTSNVTDMAGMFWDCISLTSLDISNWDTSKVTDMGGMFGGCRDLTSLDVSKWDTSKVTDMETMFYCCCSLKKLDVSNWDTGKVIGMDWMFYGCISLKELDLSKWDIRKITTAHNMLYLGGCGHLVKLYFSKIKKYVYLTDADLSIIRIILNNEK